MPDVVVARLESIPLGGGRAVRVAGLDLAVFRSADGVHVLENRCAHLDSPLADGFLLDGCLTCASHGWTYELATGRRIGPSEDSPAIGVRRYEARVVDGDIVIAIDGPAGGEPEAS